MKIMVVGGTGHIGMFLVPMLVKQNYTVQVVTRGVLPLPQEPAWKKVQLIACNTGDPQAVKSLLTYDPEVVIDIPGTARLLYDTFKGHAQHFLATGSVWMFGEPKVVPTPEKTQNPCLFEGYDTRYADILKMTAQCHSDGIAFTAIMPPNICGPGKIPLDCLGGRDIELHKKQQAGEAVILPEGPEALIGPCDAEDIAALFVLAIQHREQASGQIFNVGSAYALTASEIVATFADIFKVKIPIRRVSWPEYETKVSPGIGWYWHFKAHMCPDITKARHLCGYHPKYTPEQTLARAVDWMRQHKLL